MKNDNFLPHSEFYKYHPFTGSPLKMRDEDSLIADDSDVPVHIKPTISSCIVLYSKDKILVTRRKFDPYKDSIDLPGGFVMLGDQSFEATAAREVEEELGLKVKESDLAYLMSLTDIYPYKGFNQQVLTVVYTLELPDQLEFDIQDDVSEAFWTKVDDIDLSQIKFISMNKILDRFSRSIDLK